jgi:hypothetical protein
MGEKVMRFSDLSGQLAPDPNALASITVVDHPDLEAPVRIDALPEELEQLGKFAIKAVTLEVKMPDEEEPTRHVVTMANFNKLATDKSMPEVLEGAERVTKRRSSGAGGNGEARNHESLDWAGTPHKGKTSLIEAQLVRENLEAINERLISHGYRPGDPNNPEHARRYGFELPGGPEGANQR